MTIDYKKAGVDIKAANETIQGFKAAVEKTFSPHVLTNIGSFGALYDIKSLVKDYKHPVLVQSIDGVGTKVIIARMMNKFDTLGADLVSATANDIIVLGAKPLTLLDYIANDHLIPDVVHQIVVGMAKACEENGISLVGGETAEMPDVYRPDEIDLVGVITGVVEKDKVIMGKEITPGDAVFGLVSSGLHTNGYSLARKLLFEFGKFNVNTHIAELSTSLGEALLAPHINYTRPILHLLDNNTPIKGMAHITGGGLLENIPRILPKNCSVEIKKFSWPQQPLFNLLGNIGNLNDQEMFRTFNMGIGLVIIADGNIASEVRKILKEFPQSYLYEIGQVVKGDQTVTLCE